MSDRLTEDGKHNVLLLEAGMDDQSERGDTVHVPLNLFPNLKTDLDWEYYTEPQRNACFGMQNQVVLRYHNSKHFLHE